MITTIVTTYRRPQLLKRAIKSILNQTYPHFKICVYDNASNDETEEIMLDFVKKDSRIEYHKHPENIGMMNNYAFAYARINTPYFSFLSDDDYFLPWFYETALEGFKKYPEAALSSCGVLAVDVHNNVVADPLQGWKREGLFTVPEGIFEMLSMKSKFLPPQGVLFQHRIVKDIAPDWSKEIQVLWDPDYLIQIASQHPIIISKKISSIFLAHEDAFSTGFYQRILKSAQFLDSYLLAVVRLIKNVKKNSHISKDVKSKIKKAYVKLVKEEIGMYMRYFIHGQSYAQSYYCAKTLNKYFDIDWQIIKLLFLTLTRARCPKFVKKLLKKTKLKLFPEKKKENPTANWRPFHQYKEYVELISKD